MTLKSQTLKHRLGSAVIATALIAVTVTAGPARADKKADKLALILLGIGAIAMIANDGNHADAKPAPVKVKPHLPPVQVQPHPTLPSVCAMPLTGLTGETRGYGEACMIRNGVTLQLPDRCAYRAHIGGRADRVFAENCLAGAGIYAQR